MRNGVIQNKSCSSRNEDNFAKWVVLEGGVGIGYVEVPFQPRTFQIEVKKWGELQGEVNISTPF